MKKILTCLLSLSLLLGGIHSVQPMTIMASVRNTYKEGYDAGYEYEKRNKNTKFTSTTGSSDYKRGYEEGWYKAYDEMVTLTTDSAMENAHKDVLEGHRANLTPPRDIPFKSLYRTTYRAAYDEYKNDDKKEIELLAEENAKKDCFNLKKRSSDFDHIDSKLRSKYRTAYNEAFTFFSKELTKIKKTATSKGKSDAKDKITANSAFISDYVGYEVHATLIKLYQEAYIKAGGEIETKGEIQYNWVKENDEWTCKNPLGEVYKNQWIKSYGYWYYVKEDGKMHKGYLASGNNWYYFDESGKMVTTPQLIYGKTEKFNHQGHWIQ